MAHERQPGDAEDRSDHSRSVWPVSWRKTASRSGRTTLRPGIPEEFRDVVKIRKIPERQDWSNKVVIAGALRFNVEMPRSARLDASGALHHVIARGIERGHIFRDDADRADFVERLAARCRAADIDVLAWALIPNHVHILIRSRSCGISTVLQRVRGGYAREVNRRHRPRGHLFQNRFKSIVVEEPPFAKASGGTLSLPEPLQVYRGRGGPLPPRSRSLHLPQSRARRPGCRLPSAPLLSVERARPYPRRDRRPLAGNRRGPVAVRAAGRTGAASLGALSRRRLGAGHASGFAGWRPTPEPRAVRRRGLTCPGS